GRHMATLWRDAAGLAWIRKRIVGLPPGGAMVHITTEEVIQVQVPDRPDEYRVVAFNCERAGCHYGSVLLGVTTDRLLGVLADVPVDRSSRPWRWTPSKEDDVQSDHRHLSNRSGR